MKFKNLYEVLAAWPSEATHYLDSYQQFFKVDGYAIYIQNKTEGFWDLLPHTPAKEFMDYLLTKQQVIEKNIMENIKVIKTTDTAKDTHPEDTDTDICVKELGRKFDSGKLRYSLLPAGTVNQVVQVLEYGANKYAVDNWKHVPDAKTRYYDAAMRHIDAHWSGEVNDSETQLPHLAHAICCLMFLMALPKE